MTALFCCRLFSFRPCIFFLDAGRFTAKITQIVELRTTHATATDHIYVIDHGAMERENSLDADAVRDLADREGRASALARAADANALERLEAGLLTFGRARVPASP